MIRTSALVLFLLAACGGDDDDSADAACQGGSGCGEPCATGNSFGVGMYCTEGGGECGDTPNRLAPFCTIDFDPGAPAFCTRPCEPGDDLAMCGEDAMCTSETEGGDTGCIPVSCSN